MLSFVNHDRCAAAGSGSLSYVYHAVGVGCSLSSPYERKVTTTAWSSTVVTPHVGPPIFSVLPSAWQKSTRTTEVPRLFTCSQSLSIIYTYTTFKTLDSPTHCSKLQVMSSTRRSFFSSNRSTVSTGLRDAFGARMSKLTVDRLRLATEVSAILAKEREQLPVDRSRIYNDDDDHTVNTGK